MKVIVTGANSGLGAETTRVLAAAGAQVIMACRDPERARRVADTIDGDTSVRALDLADLASVRAFADGIDTEIDILVNNAGVMAVPEGVTADGFEVHFGVNHLGPFALTGLLLDRIRGRVVTVSSGLHRLNLGSGRWAHYGRSKLANLLFAYELQRRLTAAGSAIISVAAHPGVAATEGQRRDTSLIGKILAGGPAQAPAMGALALVYAATTPDISGGDLIGPDGFLQRKGNPAVVRSNRRSYDTARAARLWELSERLTGVRYAIAPAQSS